MIGLVTVSVALLGMTSQDSEPFEVTEKTLATLAKVENANFVCFLPTGLKLEAKPEKPQGERALMLLAGYLKSDLRKVGESYLILPKPAVQRDQEHNASLRGWILSLSEEGAYKLRDGIRLSELPPSIQQAVLGQSMLLGRSWKSITEERRDPVVFLQLGVGITVNRNGESKQVGGTDVSNGSQMYRTAQDMERSPLEASAIGNRKEGILDFGDGEVFTLSELARVIGRKARVGVVVDARVAGQTVFVAGGYSIDELMEILQLLSDTPAAQYVGSRPLPGSAAQFLRDHQGLFDVELKVKLGLTHQTGSGTDGWSRGTVRGYLVGWVLTIVLTEDLPTSRFNWSLDFR